MTYEEALERASEPADDALVAEVWGVVLSGPYNFTHEGRLCARIRQDRAELERLRNPDIEALAALEHERWAGWMRYLFGLCEVSPTDDGCPPGRHTIPADLVGRWQRQCATPYALLSEAEKESDRIEVRKTLALLGMTAQQAAGRA